MANSWLGGKAATLGCALIAVAVCLGGGGALLYGGIALITSEPAAVCGASILEEGEECSKVSRSSGESLYSFDADTARWQDDIGGNIFGGFLVLLGGILILPGIVVACRAVTGRIFTEE